MTLDIGFDIDDVLFPWSRYAHEACRAAGITNGRSITQWEFEKDYGCTREELWAVLNDAYWAGMLLRHPIDGVLAVLDEIAFDGHRIHLVTARGHEGELSALVRNDTREWLRRWRVPHSSLTFSKDKTVVPVDFFIDDNLEHYDALDVLGTKVYLQGTTHNRVKGCTRRRVNTLVEFRDAVYAQAGVLV